jgi:hypothetical protein
MMKGNDPMKWNKGTIIAVLAILLISYAYSTMKSGQLGDDIKAEKLRICSEEGRYDCGLIEQYHDECFDLSYRSQYKMKEFHPGEYERCMNSKIAPHLDAQ